MSSLHWLRVWWCGEQLALTACVVVCTDIPREANVLNSPLAPSTMNSCTAGIWVRLCGRTACVTVVISCPAATEMRSGICTKHTMMKGVGVGVGEGSTDCAYQGCVYAYGGQMRFTASAPPVTSSTCCPPSDCHHTALQGAPQGNVSSAMRAQVLRSIAAVNRDTPVVRVTQWLPKVAHWLLRHKPYTLPHAPCWVKSGGSSDEAEQPRNSSYIHTYVFI